MTERLCQFHFQALVCRWREIAASLTDTNEAHTIEELGADGMGTVLPLGLHAVSLMLLPRRSRVLSGLASLATLAGSAVLRVAIMAAGDESALRPEISLRFAQAENLPKVG